MQAQKLFSQPEVAAITLKMKSKRAEGKTVTLMEACGGGSGCVANLGAALKDHGGTVLYANGEIRYIDREVSHSGPCCCAPHMNDVMSSLIEGNPASYLEVRYHIFMSSDVPLSAQPLLGRHSAIHYPRP